MEIKGKIKKILNTVEISDRFRKREFVIEYSNNPEYPQFVQFEMVQDRCELLDQFKEGQKVSIIECRPISKSKTWILVNEDEKNGEEN